MAQKFQQYKLDAIFAGANVVTHAGAKTKWTRKREIGQGGFGTVWLEEEETGGELRAVKRLSNQSKNVDWSRELYTLAQLTDQPTLFVQFLGWYEDTDSIFVAMEYIPHGDLSQYLKTSGPQARLEAKEIIKQLLSGLEILHGRDICHRDLKPQNVLIASTTPIHVKISDFGLSKRTASSALRTHCGTSGYIAPELLGLLPGQGAAYTNSVDIWSLGVLAHEILTLQIPWLCMVSLDSSASSFFDSGSVAGQTTTTTTREVDMARLYEYCNGTRRFPTECLESAGVSGMGQGFVMRLLVADPAVRVTAKDARGCGWLLDGRPEKGMYQKPAAEISDSEEEEGGGDSESSLEPGSDSGSDSGSSPERGSDGTPEWWRKRALSQFSDPTPEESFVRLSAFIRKKGLELFFPDEATVFAYAEKAAGMFKELKAFGCTWSVAIGLTVLTLYDLVVLVDDSDASPPRVNTIRKTLSFISSIYGFARDEGILAVRFLNSGKCRRNVTRRAVKTVLKEHEFGAGDEARVGTELERKILDRYVLEQPLKMEKPLLVVVITGGKTTGEHPKLLESVLSNCLMELRNTTTSKGPASVAYQFCLTGECRPIPRAFQLLDDHKELGTHVDCFPVSRSLEIMNSPEERWVLASKLLLGAIVEYWGDADEIDDL